MNTVYNTLLTHKIRIVSGDLHNVYIFTHIREHIFYTFYTYFWRVRLHISVRGPGLLEEKLCQKLETGCGS